MQTLIPYLKYVAKAGLAGASAFCAAAATASLDGQFTQSEFWTGAGAAVAAAGLVFGIRNGSKPTR